MNKIGYVLSIIAYFMVGLVIVPIKFIRDAFMYLTDAGYNTIDNYKLISKMNQSKVAKADYNKYYGGMDTDGDKLI